MSAKKINSALISVYHKTESLNAIIKHLHDHAVTIYSTGGTQTYIESLGVPCVAVESITGYPSILDGRVKTLHPGVFGGILARREDDAHRSQLANYNIPFIDCVIVDLYPFEQTVASTDVEADIIEKIDIGGISLIRAAAKNYADVVIVPSQEDYHWFESLLVAQGAVTELGDRRYLAQRAFATSSHYDSAIQRWFGGEQTLPLRYGENPHQKGTFTGNLDELFERLGGKELSYNNLVDVDSGINLIREFRDDAPTFAVLKHTNSCGLATRATVFEAWEAALAGDPTSAFGGVFVCNAEIDAQTAASIDALFYEVLVAPAFTEEALAILCAKKQRIILRLKSYDTADTSSKTLLNGVISQDIDHTTEKAEDFKAVTQKQASTSELEDLVFAVKAVKHLKSNAIALVKNKQLIGMNCGQTSRVDALRHALSKAKAFGFDVKGSVMASEAFFPFPDCVEIGHEAGITAIAQPGGSLKDKDSIKACDELGVAMLMTGVRHFKH